MTDYRLVWVQDGNGPAPSGPNGSGPGGYSPAGAGPPPGPLGGGYGPFSNGPGLGPWNPGSGPGLLAGYQPGGPNDPNSWPLVVNWDPSGGGFSPDDFWNNDPNQQGLPPWLIAPRDGSGRDAQPILGVDDSGRPLLPSDLPEAQDRSWLRNALDDLWYILTASVPMPGPPGNTPVSSGAGQAAKNGQPNSIYEQIGPDGKVTSRTFYDENGHQFARQDFSQPHAGVQPHEHLTQFDAHGRPIAPKDWRPLPKGYDNTPTK